MRHASRRFSWFGTVARRAPYLIILVGLYVAYQGWEGLVAHAA
jgi:nickel/cobalt transporter (NicO) family protein